MAMREVNMLAEMAKVAEPRVIAAGRKLAHQGKVVNLQQDLEAEWKWSAQVLDEWVRQRVSVRMDKGGAVGNCTCLAPNHRSFCAHMAALVLAVEARTSRTPVAATPHPPNSEADVHVTMLFDILGRPVQASAAARSIAKKRVVLKAQVNLKILGGTSKPRSLGVGLSIGEGRLHVVKDIAEFLTQFDKNGSIELAKSFTYDSAEHTFDSATLKVLRALHQVQQRTLGGMYDDMHYRLTTYRQYVRYVELPPLAWDLIEPLFSAVELEWDLHPMEIVKSALPITSLLTLGEGGNFRMVVDGLGLLTVLPNYGLVFSAGRIFPVGTDLADRIYRLQSMAGGPRLTIDVPSTGVQRVMTSILPNLRELSRVKVDPVVARQVVYKPLRIAVYLDWQDATLVARLRWVYGDIEIDAADEDSGKRTIRGRIVMRDNARERAMVDWLESAGFHYRGSVFHLQEEAALFAFIYHRLPELEANPAVTLHVTDRVQPVLVRRTVSPRAEITMSSGMDWLNVSFEIEDLDPDQIRSLLASLRQRRPYHRLNDGRFVVFDGKGFQAIHDLMQEFGLKPSDWLKGKLRLPALSALSLIGREDERVIQLGKGLRRWLDDLKHPDKRETPVPESLQSILRPYQRLGFQWMKTMAHYGFGGILADDMGLGKTLQSIAFVLSEREAGPFADPALIVCPASLMYNWEHEFHRFAPTLKVAVVNGSPQEREQIWDAATHYDVLITSYPLLRRDIEGYRTRQWHAVILDEAQAIKNPATQIAQHVSDLVSPRRFALTGTPVENSLDDLWSIFHAVFPGLVANRDAFAQLTPEAVARRIRLFVLRRLKKDVLRELPDKIETVETAALTDAQRTIYLAYLHQLRAETADDLQGAGFQASRFKILAGLTRLRQICCHPGMFVEDYTGDSGKLELLLERVEEALGADKRLLIFSQFTSMLAIIEKALDARGWPYFYLDGQTPSKVRMELSQAFNQGARSVFLISLKAGGTGLNLTGADTVILYDLWWNPAVEEQAAGRAHRIGQKHVVQVIRLITEGTIEEKMYQLQQQKRDLIDRVVRATDQGLGALTEGDVRDLLTL